MYVCTCVLPPNICMYVHTWYVLISCKHFLNFVLLHERAHPRPPPCNDLKNVFFKFMKQNISKKKFFFTRGLTQGPPSCNDIKRVFFFKCMQQTLQINWFFSLHKRACPRVPPCNVFKKYFFKFMKQTLGNFFKKNYFINGLKTWRLYIIYRY